MQKFLVIQTAFIGDVVLATALLEKLHQYFPGGRIDMLVRKGNESLLTGHPFLNNVFTWDKKNEKYSNLLSLLKMIRKNNYNKVINLQRFAATGVLTAFSGAQQKIGFNKNPFSFFFTKKVKHKLAAGSHEVERNNQLIEDFTDAAFIRPKLYPSAKDIEKIKPYTGRQYVCISPASVWFTKQYPEEKWINFLNELPPQYDVYLLGGQQDVSLCNLLKEASTNENITVLAGELGFLSSAALMKYALMNYTNDSAPLHFASAVNAPVTAIFCSTVPGFGFYPLSDNSHTVQTRETLTCKPCSLHGYQACPLTHFNCAHTIETSQLLNTVNQHA
jgi:heptosyltransferase-2